MVEEKYLDTFISPSEMSPTIKNFIKSKLKEKYLYKYIQGKMITDIEIKQFNNIPLPRTTANNIDISMPVKVIYKIYKPGDIIIGDLFTHDIDMRVFVISNDIICDIVNIDDVENIQTRNIYIRLTNIKSTSGCNYFLAVGSII